MSDLKEAKVKDFWGQEVAALVNSVIVIENVAKWIPRVQAEES